MAIAGVGHLAGSAVIGFYNEFLDGEGVTFPEVPALVPVISLAVVAVAWAIADRLVDDSL